MRELVMLDVKENGVAVLTLNRPKYLNAFDEQLTADIVDAGKEVAARDDIKVLVLTGAGPGFCAGGDIATLAAMNSPARAKETYDVSTAAVRAMYEQEIPVIAAVNGGVAGAGTALMMACDLIVASENAKIAFSFSNVAFCPDSGCSHFLFQKVGYRKALEILWFARTISAAEALELGLINKVVPHETLMDEAMSWANRLASGPLMTLKMDKKLLRVAQFNDYYQQTELESLYQILTWASDDFREGVQAFVEKRKPMFKGR